MKRLTERDEYGNADIIALADVMPEIYASLSFAETNALTEALNRLADYEDSGILPDKLAENMNLIKYNVYAIGKCIENMKSEEIE